MHNEVIYISKDDLQQRDPLAWLSFAYALDQQAVKNAFSKIGITITGYPDLEKIAKIIRSGGDIKGKIKNENGRPIFFNGKALLASLPIKNVSLEKIKKGRVKII